MEQETTNASSYSASNIQVLEGLEAVRKRPAMYIGDISEKGLHHLVYEVVDNSIDESLAGYCTHIEVTINEDNSITVQDNGRGIPVDMHEKEHKSALEVVMTVLHAGGKFDKGSYKVSGGLHGVGVSCVNGLSTRMKSQVFRDGKIYQQEYACGKPLYDVKVVGETDKRGTRQQFWPDASIFTTTVYKYDILANRMRELAYLNAGLTITLMDMRKDVNEAAGFEDIRKDVFHSEGGLKDFVKYIDSSRTHLFNDVIYLNTEKQNIPIEVAIMYNTSYSENIHSYVNNINTIEGGTHLTGFRAALTRVLKKYAEDTKVLEKLEKLTKENMTKDIELAELKRIKNVENIDVTLSEEQEKRMRLLKTSIRDLNLSRRALNTLVDYDIQHKNMKTLGDIATRTVKEIRSIYNLGYHTYIELSDVIEHYGLCWNIDIDYFILTGNVNVKIKEG